MAYGHSRGNAVRIHDYVGDYAVRRERHVFSFLDHSTSSLLPMPGGKFITNLWNSNISGSYFDEFSMMCVLGNYHKINGSSFTSFRPQRHVFDFGFFWSIVVLVVSSGPSGNWFDSLSQSFSNDYLLAFHEFPRPYYAIFIKFSQVLL